MKITIEIPQEMEKLLMEKCERNKVSPAEFIQLLLDWYFFKRKKRSEKRSELAYELEEFLKIAKQMSMEKVKYCKFSDGVHCGKELLEKDFFAEAKEPEPISPYKCLFCQYYIDRRREDEETKRERRKLEFKDISEAKIHDLAKIAAKYVVELYSDRLIKIMHEKLEERMLSEGEEEIFDETGEEEVREPEVKKALDW
jgi:hypothetical protein